MARPTPLTSRTRILAAAADEFGARGFAATTVDRIARRARVNKAMIYYYFPNKRALYTAIFRELHTAVAEKLGAIAAEPLPPDRKLDRLIEAMVQSIDAAGHFLPVFLREVADGGVHLGPAELALIGQIFTTVSGVIIDGAKQRAFRPVHPALAHFTLIGPLIMFRATAPLRARITAIRRMGTAEVDSAMLVEHLQTVARRMLAPGDSVRPAG